MDNNKNFEVETLFAIKGGVYYLNTEDVNLSDHPGSRPYILVSDPCNYGYKRSLVMMPITSNGDASDIPLVMKGKFSFVSVNKVINVTKQDIDNVVPAGRITEKLCDMLLNVYANILGLPMDQEALKTFTEYIDWAKSKSEEYPTYRDDINYDFNKLSIESVLNMDCLKMYDKDSLFKMSAGRVKIADVFETDKTSVPVIKVEEPTESNNDTTTTKNQITVDPDNPLSKFDEGIKISVARLVKDRGFDPDESEQIIVDYLIGKIKTKSELAGGLSIGAGNLGRYISDDIMKSNLYKDNLYTLNKDLLDCTNRALDILKKRSPKDVELFKQLLDRDISILEFNDKCVINKEMMEKVTKCFGPNKEFASILKRTRLTTAK